MSDEWSDLCPDTITVSTYTGSGGMGATYAEPVTYGPDTDTGVSVQHSRRLVRDDRAAEVLSESSIHDPDVSHAATYANGSKVTLPGGRVATVITVRVYADPSGLMPESLEVMLT